MYFCTIYSYTKYNYMKIKIKILQQNKNNVLGKICLKFF